MKREEILELLQEATIGTVACRIQRSQGNRDWHYTSERNQAQNASAIEQLVKAARQKAATPECGMLAEKIINSLFLPILEGKPGMLVLFSPVFDILCCDDAQDSLDWAAWEKVASKILA